MQKLSRFWEDKMRIILNLFSKILRWCFFGGVEKVYNCSTPFFCFLQPEKKTLKFFKNPYFCPEQWSMVRPTTYLVHGIWMYGCTDYGRPMKPFSLKSRTFGLGRTNWADKFCSIWGHFGRTISTYFCTVSRLSMYFYKKLSLYIKIGIIYLGFGFESGLQMLNEWIFDFPL